MKLKIHLVALISTILKIYPRLTVAALFPSDEYNMIHYVKWIINNDGSTTNLLSLPHLEFYLIYFIHKITGIDGVQISYYINPIISGISVYAFYYMLSILMDEQKAILGTTLYAFNDSVFYRAAHFGSSEILGLLFLFLFFGLYYRKQYLRAVFILPLIAYSHILPLLFAIGTICIQMLRKKATWVYAVILGCGGILFLISPISSHKNQTSTFLIKAFKSFSLSNVFVYSINELLRYALYYSGTVFLGLITLFYFKRWKTPMKEMGYTALFGLLASFLIYSSNITGPTRLIVYIAISFICVGVEHLKKKHFMFLLSLMILTPYLGGIDNLMWVKDSITTEEIAALDWADEQGYIERRFLYVDPLTGTTYHKNDWYLDESTLQYAQLMYSSYNIHETNFTYVLSSPRTRKQSFFLVRYNDGTRSEEIRKPVPDIWDNNTSQWEIIYDFNEVKIYRRISR